MCNCLFGYRFILICSFIISIIIIIITIIVIIMIPIIIIIFTYYHQYYHHSEQTYKIQPTLTLLLPTPSYHRMETFGQPLPSVLNPLHPSLPPSLLFLPAASWGCHRRVSPSAPLGLWEPPGSEDMVTVRSFDGSLSGHRSEAVLGSVPRAVCCPLKACVARVSFVCLLFLLCLFACSGMCL